MSYTFEAVIKNKLGIHARIAALLVKLLINMMQKHI